MLAVWLNLGLNSRNNFTDMKPEVQATKTKIDNWYHVKLKVFFTALKTINRVKKQPMEWKKTFANHISNERLILKIYKKLLQLNSKKRKQKPNNLIFKIS